MIGLAKISCFHEEGHGTTSGVRLEYVNRLCFKQPVKVVKIKAIFACGYLNPGGAMVPQETQAVQIPMLHRFFKPVYTEVEREFPTWPEPV